MTGAFFRSLREQFPFANADAAPTIGSMGRTPFVFLGGALVSFVLAASALAGARDLVAIYWLMMGVVCTQCATRWGEPGAKGT